MKKRRVFDLDFPDELPDAPSKAKTLPVGKSAGSSPEAKVARRTVAVQWQKRCMKTQKRCVIA